MNQNDHKETEVKLIWCSPHPNHYNSYLFDHLAVLEDVSLEVVYFSKKIAKYPWTSTIAAAYPVHYLKKGFGIDWLFLIQRIKSKEELLLVAGWNEPTMLLLLLWFSFTDRPFLLYSDTPDLRKRKGFKQWIRKKILNRIFKKVYRFLVTGTPGVENAKQLGIAEQRLVNFPFATNTNFFIPKSGKVDRASEEITFISSGRLDNAHKAFNLAIRAFHLLKNKHPEYRFQYFIAGDGPDKKALSDLIHTLDLEKEVLLKGWLEPIDLLVFYRSGDVFLHPSNFDPFPNAVLEAMSCGLPVIGSSAAGSVVDRVEEAKNGYIHQQGNAEELYQKLVLMYQQSKEEREKMGMKSRETALQWDVSYHTGIIKELLKDYTGTQETLAKKGRKR